MSHPIESSGRERPPQAPANNVDQLHAPATSIGCVDMSPLTGAGFGDNGGRLRAVSQQNVDGDRIAFTAVEITPEARAAADAVLASGWVTTGPEVAAFEREFAARVGAEHAVAVSSCTAAIQLGLRALRLPRGAKVLSPVMTFCGAVHAIVQAGLTPVLVDIDPGTLMPDAETTTAAVARAGGVDAMVALHFAGAPVQVAQLAAGARL